MPMSSGTVGVALLPLADTSSTAAGSGDPAAPVPLLHGTTAASPHSGFALLSNLAFVLAYRAGSPRSAGHTSLSPSILHEPGVVSAIISQRVLLPGSGNTAPHSEKKFFMSPWIGDESIFAPSVCFHTSCPKAAP